MFDALDTQELVNLAHVLVGANRRIGAVYGHEDILNVELCALYDDLLAAAEVKGLAL